MHEINRRGFISTILSFFLSIMSNSAFAVNGPTLKPTKAGQVIIWRNKKYTSMKSGKSLIWDKGMEIVIPSPSQSASPTASQTPSSAPVLPAQAKDIRIAASSELGSGETKIFMLKDKYGRGKPYILTRTQSGLVAFDNVCTHEGCGVEVENKHLICKCHNSTFDNNSGKALSGPAFAPLKSYPVKEVNGEILVFDFPW